MGVVLTRDPCGRPVIGRGMAGLSTRGGTPRAPGYPIEVGESAMMRIGSFPNQM